MEELAAVSSAQGVDLRSFQARLSLVDERRPEERQVRQARTHRLERYSKLRLS